MKEVIRKGNKELRAKGNMMFYVQYANNGLGEEFGNVSEQVLDSAIYTPRKWNNFKKKHGFV